MICPNCQKNLPDGILVCDGCGFRLSLHSDSAKEVPQGKETYRRTKVAQPRSDVGITKVHVESGLSATKVGKTYEMKPTKIFGQIQAPRPIFGWLVVLEGKDKWQQFVIPDEEGRHIIGNDSDCDIRFQDKGVEPNHASLRLKEGKLFLSDLDTASETKVRGEDISRVELQDGDEIKIGSINMKFRKL